MRVSSGSAEASAGRPGNGLHDSHTDTEIAHGHGHDHPRTLEAQLASLYAERQTLEKSIGCSDATDVIGLVHKLEGQITTLQADLMTARTPTVDADGAATELRNLRAQFADCGKPEIVYESIDGRRTLRVVWKAAA